MLKHSLLVMWSLVCNLKHKQLCRCRGTAWHVCHSKQRKSPSNSLKVIAIYAIQSVNQSISQSINLYFRPFSRPYM